MKLSSLQISDVKRIKAVSIDFNQEGMTIIGGRNRQGKTSVLSSIMYALGGEKFRPTNFKREGSEEDGFIRITFDDGMIVERKGKNAALTVIDSTGQKRGQQLLDDFVSKFSIDLPRFMDGTDREKADILLKIIGVGDQLEKLDKEEESKYNERTDVGRLAERKKKACEELEFYPDVPAEEISLLDLTNKLKDVLTRNAAVRASVQKIEQNKCRLAKLVENGQNLENQKSALKSKTDAQRDALKRQMEALEENYRQQEAAIKQSQTDNDEAIELLADEITKAESIEYTLEDTSSIEAEIKTCEATNAKVKANRDRAEKLKEADDLKAEYDELTKQVEDVRRRRQELLDGADLPYPGLSVQNGMLYLNGKAWDCMSGAEQLIVACSISMRINDKCNFVLMDKLEQFDLETLNDFEKWCESKGLQVIATRVSTGTECKIVIEDGLVAGQEDVVIDKTPTKSAKKTVKANEASSGKSPLTVSNDGEGIEIPHYDGITNDGVSSDDLPPQEESPAMKAARELLARKRASITSGTANA